MSTNVHIITLIKKPEVHRDKEHYTISIEIVTRNRLKTTLEKRQKEGYVSDDVVGFTSQELELQLESKKCVVCFKLDGALRPHMPVPGEDEITYNEKSKSEARREIVAVPNRSGDHDNMAAISFSVLGKHLHKVTITDIPEIRRSVSSSSSFSSVGGAQRQDSMAPDIGSLQIQDQVPGSSMEGTQYMNTSFSGGQSSVGGVNAVPFSRTGSSTSSSSQVSGHPTSVLRGTSVPNTVDGGYGLETVCGSTFEEEGYDYGLLLKEASLRVIVASMTPGEFNTLVTVLEVPNEKYQAIKKDNPSDIVEANFQALQFWRKQSQESSVETSAMKQVQQLIQGLGCSGRNDMKRRIENIIRTQPPRQLTSQDFK